MNPYIRIIVLLAVLVPWSLVGPLIGLWIVRRARGRK